MYFRDQNIGLISKVDQDSAEDERSIWKRSFYEVMLHQVIRWMGVDERRMKLDKTKSRRKKPLLIL